MKLLKLLINTSRLKRSYETFLFGNLKQNEGEFLNEFYIRLKEQSTKCGFENADLNIKQQIELSTNIDKLRLYSFQHPDKSLQELLTIGRAFEATSKQTEEISKKKISDEEIFYAKNGGRFNRFKDKNDVGKIETRRGMSSQKSCYKCGGKFPHRNRCPAEGKTCNKCHKINHFAVVCRSNKARGNKSNYNSNKNKSRKPLNSLEDTTHSSPVANLLYESTETLDLDEILFAVNETELEENTLKAVCNKNSRTAFVEDMSDAHALAVNTKSEKFNSVILVEGVKVNFLVDTGASVSILTLRTYKQLCERLKIQPKLEKAKISVHTYGSDSKENNLNVLGKIQLTVETPQKISYETFYVIDTNHKNLLSGKVALELDILLFKNPVYNLQECEKVEF